MTFFRVLILSAIVSLSFVQPVQAQEEKSFWLNVFEFFYPSLRAPEENPFDTLQAPFSDAGEDVVNPLVLSVDEVVVHDSFDTPHRLSGDIAEWLAVTLTDVMTFQSDDYQEDLGRTAKYFDANGRALYLKFLEENKIIRILESDKFYVRSFVQDAPLLLNEGEVDGYYRWLFDVPVLVSYMDRNLKDYAKGDATTQVMDLRVQLMRSPEAGKSGVVIDLWEGEAGQVVKP